MLAKFVMKKDMKQVAVRKNQNMSADAVRNQDTRWSNVTRDLRLHKRMLCLLCRYATIVRIEGILLQSVIKGNTTAIGLRETRKICR